jgi:Polyketide cyclase / dehydrase and lipid transport
MTAVADVQAGTVHATVEIAASPESVFRALTDPGELPRWWGSPDVYQTHDWKVDLHTLEKVPGGTRLSLFHRGLVSEESTRGHTEGWTQVLGWLANRFAGTQAARSSA